MNFLVRINDYGEIIKLTTGTVAATSGICESTIGGGIYCSGNFTGIASDGATCGTVNSPSVYTQVIAKANVHLEFVAN